MIKITIILVFVLVLFSSCSKNVENCKIKPKIDMEMKKNSESDKKSVNLEQTEAEISCNF